MNGITAALTGRIGADAELRYTSAGKPMATFNVAVDDTKRSDDDKAEWLRVTVWDALAEEMAGRLVKGAGVYLEGRLKMETWQDREGAQRSTLKLSAWTVQPLGQIGRQAPRRQGDQPRRPNAMPQAMAVGAGRNTRRALGLDEGDLERMPFS